MAACDGASRTATNIAITKGNRRDGLGNDAMGFELVCCVELKDSQVYNHLMPVAMHPEVDAIWIVRSRKSDFGDIPKARYVIVSGESRVLRWVRMLWKCLALARRREVKAFLSFNPFPYGVIGFIAARLFRKQMHFGLIGADWNKHATGRLAPVLLPFLRRGCFVTTYGATVRMDMIARGIDADRVVVLPHSISIARFPVERVTAPHYDAIYTGALIQRKRVDVILRGFAEIVRRNPAAKLCIVGDGPLRENLQKLAKQLGIANAVDFLGYVNDVQPYLAQSKTLVMASASEGFPFSIVEALCSGVVPITTRVNAIGDFLEDGVTALFFPQDDWRELATRLAALLEDSERYNRMRENVIALRESFSFEAAAKVWRPWLNSLAAPSAARSLRSGSSAVG